MLEIQLTIPGQLPHTRRLESGEYTIGRGLTANIRLRHDSVAKRHALLSIRPGHAVLKNLAQCGPVERNGVPVSQAAPARQGDTFVLGDCEMRIVDGSTDSPPAPAGMIEPLPQSTCNEHSTGAWTPDVSAETSPQLPTVDELRPLKEKLQELVLRELDLFRRTALNSLADADLRNEAQQAIEAVIAGGAILLPADIDRAQFIKEMTAEIMGYGPIEPFLADDSVSEVMVNGPGQIYVERNGRLSGASAHFTNADSLMRVIERIVSPLGRRIDEGAPMVDARLPDGSRVNAVIPPLSLIGPILTIRKFSKQRFSMERLVETGALTPQMAEFLRVCIRYRRNIVVAGGTGSGKTTLLNALSESIPAHERIVTIEDAAELRLAQPHVLSLEARPPNVEGRGEVAIRDLVRNALRMRPDRIIVGECRGGEALDMLQAMNTGHDGSLTTAHANSPRDLLSRLEVMVLMAGMDLPVRAIREQISSAIDVIVQQSRFSDGRRRVTSIVEVDGMEGDVILTQALFAFKQRGVGPSGEVLGNHIGFDQAPRFYEGLTDSGVRLERDIFAA